jgi:4a-hydroxytetrahydrobiopterin dehydratase
MDMLRGEQIAEANLTDWRKLAQGLHARYLVGDFGTGARFGAGVGEAGDALGHHPRVTMGDGYVEFKLLSDDAVYRDDEGAEHVVEWVTQRDVDLARRITETPTSTRSTPTRPRSPRSSSHSTRRTRRRSPRCGLPC